MMTLPAFFFNFLAGIYYSKEIRTLLQKAIAPQPGLRLLDVPCGTGTLKDLCKPCAYVGGDLDTKRVLQAGLGGNANSFLTLDASQMPFADRSFDRILRLLSSVFCPLVCSGPKTRTFCFDGIGRRQSGFSFRPFSSDYTCRSVTRRTMARLGQAGPS